MEQINYEKLLPLTPRADAVCLAREAGRFKRSYLIYRADRQYLPLEDRSEPAVRVVCSACGGSFWADKISSGGCHNSYAPAPFGWWNEAEKANVISHDNTPCPLCGKEGQVRHAGSMGRGELVDDAWVTELLRVPVEGFRDRLALLEWCIRRCIDREGRTRYEVRPYTAWVVEETKVVRLTAYGKYMGSISLKGEWKQLKAFSDVYRKMDVLVPWDPALLEGTTAENCKLDLYINAGGRRLVGYLALWRRHPAVENLLVQGCGKLVAEWIRTETEGYGYHGGIPRLTAVNWREKRPAQMLGLTKEEFRHLRQEKWTADDLKRFRLVIEKSLPVKLPEDMDLLRNFAVCDVDRVLSEGEPAEFWRTLRYLQKQGRDWTTLQDYWHMAARQGRDLTDSLVRWPRDLLRAHNDALARQKHIEDEALRKKFKERLEVLEAFAWERDGLLIRPCRSQRELIAEGKILHHCVASYAEYHAKGRAAIFFIRQADKPDKPFYTLELDEKHLIVRQNRGLRNCDRTPEVTAFEAAWLDWLRQKARRIA